MEPLSLYKCFMNGSWEIVVGHTQYCQTPVNWPSYQLSSGNLTDVGTQNLHKIVYPARLPGYLVWFCAHRIEDNIFWNFLYII